MWVGDLVGAMVALVILAIAYIPANFWPLWREEAKELFFGNRNLPPGEDVGNDT